MLSAGRRVATGSRPQESSSEAPAVDEVKQSMLDRLDTLTSDAPVSEEQKQLSLQCFRYYFRYLLEALPTTPSRQWTVLEAGVGMCGWSHLFGQFFDTVYGADIEDYSEYHPGVKFITADLTQGIPLPDQSVDLVVCYSVLEHVLDVPAALANFDRVLKVAGHLHLTVDPLYYSAQGSHIYGPKPFENWEHLDPRCERYLLGNPLPDADTQGHVLNKMTYSDFLAWVGRFPWLILRSQTTIDPRPVPDYVDRGRWSEMDLRTRGFNLVARKEWHFAGADRRLAAA